MKNKHMLIIGLVIITFVLIYVFNDVQKEPKYINDPATNLSVPTCDEGYTFKEDSKVCYNPSPLGHAVVPTFQLFAWILTFATLVDYEFESHRMYRSSKMLYFEDKYQKENRPIPKSSDVYSQGGFTWMFKGYDAILESKEPELHFSKDSMLAKVGINYIFQGARQEISRDFLMTYIKNNPRLYRRIFSTINYDDPNLRIFIPVPLPPEETKRFYSLSGQHSFRADRFSDVIRTLFKMRKGISFLDLQMTESSKDMLRKGTTMSQQTAIMSDAVGKTQGQKIVDYREMDAQRAIRESEDRRKMNEGM